MRELSASFTRAASSSNDKSRSMALRARARYMAPLSRFTYPSLRASRDAIVLLPAPAGPSMAIISFRGVASSTECSVILSEQVRARLYTDAEVKPFVGKATSLRTRLMLLIRDAELSLRNQD